MRRVPLFLLAAALAGPCVAADLPSARPLEREPPPTAAPGGDEPARTLPPSVAVCHEPGGLRCWTMPLAEDCAKDGGRVFRVVPGDADGRDAKTALQQCRLAAESPRERRPGPPRAR